MAPRSWIVAIIALLAFGSIQAQQERRWQGDLHPTRTSLFGASHGHRAHFGFFPSRGFGPVIQLPEDLSRFLVMEHALFGNHRPTRISRGPHRFSGAGIFGFTGSRFGRFGHFGHHPFSRFGSTRRHFSGGVYGGTGTFGFTRGLRAPLYSSRNFVEEWSGREPRNRGTEASLKDSILLAEGMKDVEVMRRLGSPIQRLRLGNREVWTYSAYSLVFEEGALKEIR